MDRETFLAANPLLIINNKKEIIFSNKNFQRLFNGLYSENLHQLFNEDTLQLITDIIDNQLFDEDEIKEGFFSNQKRFDFTLSNYQINNQNNYIIHFIHSPCQTSEKFKWMDVLPMGVIYSSLTGDIIYSNQKGRKLFQSGNNHGEFNLFTNPLVKDTQLIKDISDCFENEKTVIGKIETIIKKEIVAIEYVIMLNNCDDPFVEIYFSDKTNEYNLENELEKTKEDLRVADRSKNYIMSNISHELRTPLNGIFGMISLLKGTPINSNQNEFLDMLRISAENLLHRINDILDYSSLINSKITLNTHYFKPKQIIDKICDYFIEQCAKKNLRFIVDYEIKHDFLVKGDSIRFQQILINLIENSIKFTESGNISLKIYIEVENTDTVLFGFCLKDTGIGISQEKKDEIFNSFIQADITHTRKYGGIGLGLSIVKQLLDLMNGMIFIDSKENQGTTINFYIPFQVKTSLPASTADKSDCVRKKLKILIAEDDPINLFYLNELLKKNGHIVESESNGSKVIEMIKQFQPDLLILDIGLPKVNGLDLTRLIRQNMEEPLNKLPVIALTSFTEEETEKKALNLGVNVYLKKPLNEYQLLKEINTLSY